MDTGREPQRRDQKNPRITNAKQNNVSVMRYAETKNLGDLRWIPAGAGPFILAGWVRSRQEGGASRQQAPQKPGAEAGKN